MIGVLTIILMLAYGALSNIFGMHKVFDKTKFGLCQCIFVLFIKTPFEVFLFYLLADCIIKHLI